MDKFAQQRDLLNRLREKTNLTGMAAEKFFNKEFGEAMAKLRVSDDEIRKAMLGETAESRISMKELLGMTKSSLNRREYVEAFTDLGKIHSQLLYISKIIVGVKSDMNAVHEDMLLKKYKDDDKLSPKEKEKVLQRRKELAELQKRLAAHGQNQLIKQAKFNDFFKNIFTADGRALIAWEKRYPEQVAKWRNGTSAMLEQAKLIYVQLINQLKIMAKARASRNLDAYLEAAQVVLKPISDFDKNFKKYYQDAMQPLIKKLELDNPATPTQTTDAPPVLNKEVVEAPKSDLSKTTLVEEPLATEQDPFPKLNVQPISEPLLDDMFKKKLPLPSEVKSASHAQFYRVLEKFAGESPIILKSMIAKYAKSIINSDLKTSVRLSKIASNIKIEE